MAVDYDYSDGISESSYINQNHASEYTVNNTRGGQEIRRTDPMGNDFIVDSNQVEQIDGMTTVYPYCMHERDLSNIMIPWHWHEELELGYIAKGTSKIITLEGTHLIHQGDGFFINSNVMDMKSNAQPGTEVLEINHIFHPVFLSGHFKSIYETKYITPITNDHSVTVHVIRRGHKSADQLLDKLEVLHRLQSLENQEMQTRNILSECWLLLAQELKEHAFRKEAIPSAMQERLQSMISYIHQNYQQKITAAQISSAAHISEREAVRIFQKNIGMSPIEYLLSYRLNESLKYLTQTDLSITEISYECGFSESAYFGKMFKKQYGQTPSEYRQQNMKH